MSAHILICHPDSAVARSLKEQLVRSGYRVSAVESVSGASARLAAEPDLEALIFDSRMSDRDKAMLKSAAAKRKNVLALIPAMPPTEMRRPAAVAAGAIVISDAADDIGDTISRALGQGTPAPVFTPGKQLDTPSGRFGGLSTIVPEMQRVLDLAQRATGNNTAVLIQGEDGTEKLALARAIHRESRRAARPFAPFCIGDEIAMGEFDAILSEMDGGTLYISDVGKASPELQARLMAAVMGGTDGRGANVRLIFATSLDLVELVKAKQFREDLFYRLNIAPIWIPALRERRADLSHTLKSLLTRYSAEEGKRIDGIAPRALLLLERYEWPGNMRQLENVMFRAVALADGSVLTVREFPQIAAQVDGFAVELPPEPRSVAKKLYDGPAMIGAAVACIETVPIRGGHGIGIPALNENGDVRRIEAVEADLIRLALGHYRGHMTEVARKLGIGRSTLYRKMREFGLDHRVH